MEYVYHRYTEYNIIDRRKTIDVSSILYYSAFCIWMFASILYYTSLFGIYLDGAPYRIVRYFTIGLLVFSEILSGRHNLWSLGFLFFILFAGIALGAQYSGRVIDCLLFIYCSRNRSFRRIAKAALVFMCMAFLLVVMSAAKGIIQNYITYSQGRTREYLGFRYALYPSQLIFTITCLFIYLREWRMRLIEYILLAAINYIVFNATQSRLSFYLSIAMLVLAAIMKITRGAVILGRGVGFVCSLSFIICSCIMLILTISYSSDNSTLLLLDSSDILSGRLVLGKNALNQYGILPFGQYIYFVGNGIDFSGIKTVGTYNYVDSLYVLMLVEYGWVFFAGFIAMFTIVSWKSWKNRNPWLLLVIVFLALHGTIDDLILHLYFNPFILLIGETLMPRSWRWGALNGSSQNESVNNHREQSGRNVKPLS